MCVCRACENSKRLWGRKEATNHEIKLLNHLQHDVSGGSHKFIDHSECFAFPNSEKPVSVNSFAINTCFRVLHVYGISSCESRNHLNECRHWNERGAIFKLQDALRLLWNHKTLPKAHREEKRNVPNICVRKWKFYTRSGGVRGWRRTTTDALRLANFRESTCDSEKSASKLTQFRWISQQLAIF